MSESSLSSHSSLVTHQVSLSTGEGWRRESRIAESAPGSARAPNKHCCKSDGEDHNCAAADDDRQDGRCDRRSRLHSVDLTIGDGEQYDGPDERPQSQDSREDEAARSCQDEKACEQPYNVEGGAGIGRRAKGAGKATLRPEHEAEKMKVGGSNKHSRQR